MAEKGVPALLSRYLSGLILDAFNARTFLLLRGTTSQKQTAEKQPESK